MQTFTILFGFAIVAIAVEKFTAEFLHVNSRDAAAKGHQEIQSRTEDGMQYFLRGVTGTEVVMITDGEKTRKEKLNVDNKELYATHNKINIEFINDECCDPNDKNVLFTPGYKISRIYVEHNDNITRNYFENWNCSACATSPGPKMRNQMDLQSRKKPVKKPDMCYLTRKDDDCLKCKAVKDGQFCYPGKYTVEFKTENQCENVTFGECAYPESKKIETEPGVGSAKECNLLCKSTERCMLYRYNRETQECIYMKSKYRKADCNIRAGPMDKTAGDCLYIDFEKSCDGILEEDCEYNGELLKRHAKGDVVTSEQCEENCKLRAPRCQYWVFHREEKLCILKKAGTMKCKVSSGPAMTKFEYEECKKLFDNRKK